MCPMHFQIGGRLFIDDGLGCIEAGAGIVEEKGGPVARGGPGRLVRGQHQERGSPKQEQGDYYQDEFGAENALHVCSSCCITTVLRQTCEQADRLLVTT